MYNHQLFCACCISAWPISHIILPISFINTIIIYADGCISICPNSNPNVFFSFSSGFALTNVNPFDSIFVCPVLLNDVVCAVGVLIVKLPQPFVSIPCLREVGSERSQRKEVKQPALAAFLVADSSIQKDTNVKVAEIQICITAAQILFSFSLIYKCFSIPKMYLFVNK